MKVIESLLDRGIYSMDNIQATENLAHRVFNLLWERVESSILVGERELRNSSFPIRVENSIMA